MIPDSVIDPHTDSELLRRFVLEAAAPAFTELVRRHVKTVYSSALRRVNGDHALAEDVTQTVFADFARQASRLPEGMPPGGWLHRHTGFVAAKMIDRERRRRSREERAADMNERSASAAPDPEWSAAAPLLDAALDALPGADRDAIVLRFFEQRDYRSVGEALGVSDDTAQKKVSRALEKLRHALGRRGVMSTGGALAALLAANAAVSVPAASAGDIAGKSLAGAALAGRTLGGALTGLTIAARWRAAIAGAALTGVAAAAGWVIVREKPDHSSGAAASAEKESALPVAETIAPKPAVPQKPADPADSLSVAELVAAAAAEWREGRETVSSSARALGFLARVRPEQMKDALAVASALENDAVRSLVTKYLISHWAEAEPQAAMQWASSEAGGHREADLVRGVMDAWAARNPEAVMGWGGKTGTAMIQVSDATLVTVFRSLAGRDPALALRRLESLSGPVERGQALRGIAETIRSDADRERLFAAAAGLTNDEIRIQARRSLVEQWARRDAAAAAAYVEKAEPAWERTRMMDSLGFYWMQRDPAGAADWWSSHAPGPDTLVKIVNVWSQQDPNAAGEWLRKQPAGPGFDAARMTFSRQVADLDPESALRWAETVSDAAMRESTIDHVFESWSRRDAAAAGDFLKRSSWPAERVTRLHGPR